MPWKLVYNYVSVLYTVCVWKVLNFLNVIFFGENVILSIFLYVLVVLMDIVLLV